MLKIQLLEKSYVAPRPKARYFRQALEITQERDLNALSPLMLDELLQFVCDVFANQFTIDDIYDGYESSNLVGLVQETIMHVVGNENVEDGKKK
ncbi:phage tail assembly chaperone G [Sutcliffiella horikoshii]|uniref:phage tail assembly chaperone G n=1 Tax=Sutcliffiella horikoshii TaxID=79883 RepID=UPI003CE9DA8E